MVWVTTTSVIKIEVQFFCISFDYSFEGQVFEIYVLTSNKN